MLFAAQARARPWTPLHPREQTWGLHSAEDLLGPFLFWRPATLPAMKSQELTIFVLSGIEPVESWRFEQLVAVSSSGKR